MSLRDRAIPPLSTCVLLAGLAAAGTHAAPSMDGTACAVDEAHLVGAWRHAGGAGFFEEFELAREADARVLRSWLHQRPALGGHWAFDPAACRLRITGTGMRWDYHVGLHGETLHLHETPGQDARYLRIAD